MTTFETYNFDDDSNWRIYLEDALIPQNPNYYNALYKLKQKYYKRKIDPDYEIKELKTTSPPTPTPEPQTQTPPQPRPSTTTQRASSSGSGASATPNTNSSARNQSSAFSRYLYISWMISQVSVLVFTVLYLIGSPYNFYRAILASLIGYLVSLFPTFEGLLPFSKEKLLPLIKNDNVHYLSFCLMFYFMGVPSVMVLLPNVIYSFYHVLTRMIPVASSFRVPESMIARLRMLESKKQIAIETAVRFEVYMMIYLFFGLFTRQTSIFLLFNYYQFLKLRNQYSASTKRCLIEIGMLIDQKVVQNQSVPPMIRNLVGKVKNYFSQ